MLQVQSLFKNSADIATKTRNCSACQMHRNCESPMLPAIGKCEKGILIIEAYPSATEDLMGRLGVGEAHQLLEETLHDLGIDLLRDCAKVTCLACHPTDVKKLNKQAPYCAPGLNADIAKFKPKVIILLGSMPIVRIIGDVWKKGIADATGEVVYYWRGFKIPSKKHNCWLAPMDSPSSLVKAKRNEFTTKYNAFVRDLKEAVALIHEEPKTADIDSTCHVLDDNKAVEYLQNVLTVKPPHISFDYETTGIKPYNKNMKAVCVSLCFQADYAVAFMLNKNTIPLFREVLQCDEIGKTAHNMRMELLWSVCKLKVAPNFVWDSILATHILDSRAGICSLKFQSFVNFGVEDYSAEIQKYIVPDSTKENSGNAINQIDEAPQEQLLKYCAADSLLEFLLTEKQMGLLTDSLS